LKGGQFSKYLKCLDYKYMMNIQEVHAGMTGNCEQAGILYN